jgi:hypothetical protein
MSWPVSRNVTEAKKMLISFFGCEGIIYQVCPNSGDRKPEVLTPNIGTFETTGEARNVPHKWILYNDRAPLYTALSVKEFLTKKYVVVLQHPTYSADHAPCDFFGFPTMKNHRNGSHFETVKEIQKVNGGHSK